MKKSYKRIFLLVLTIILSFAASGCANTGKSPDQDTEPPAEEGGVITFYNFSDWMATEPFASAYQAAAEEFEANNPGFSVELESDPWNDWQIKNKTMLASGNPPDIFLAETRDFPVFANSGALLNMSDYFDADYLSDFTPSALEICKWQGEQVALPYAEDCRVLWYNKDIFEAAGLDPNQPPETWAELVEYAKTITENTTAYGFGMDLGLTQMPAQSLFCATGSSLVTVASDGTVSPNIDTPEFRAYLQVLKDMKPYYEPDYANLDQNDVGRLYVAGQLGMIIGNTLSEAGVYDTDFWAQAAVPVMTKGDAGGTFRGGFDICVSSETEHPEKAVEFVQLLLSAKYNGSLIGSVPVTNAGKENSEYGTDPRFKTYVDQLAVARTPQPMTINYIDIDDCVRAEVIEMLVADKSVDDVISDLTSQVEEILNP